MKYKTFLLIQALFLFHFFYAESEQPHFFLSLQGSTKTTWNDQGSNSTSHWGGNFVLATEPSFNGSIRFFCRTDNRSYKDSTWASSFLLAKNVFPITIKAGMISPGGSWSKIKNPVPSVPSSAVSSSFSESLFLSATLVSLSSSQKQQGLFIQQDFTRFRIPLILSQAVMEDQTIIASAKSDVKFSPGTTLSAGISLANFKMNGCSSYLSKNNISFEPERAWTATAGLTFKSPFFKHMIQSGFYPDQFGIDCFWISTKNRISINFFSADFNYFYIPTAKYSPSAAPLINPGSSIIKTLQQFTFTPGLSFFLSDGTGIKTGLSITEIWKMAGPLPEDVINIMKVTGSFSATNSYTFRTDLSMVNILLYPEISPSAPEPYGELKIYYHETSTPLKSSISITGKQYVPQRKGSKLKQTISGSIQASPEKTGITISSSFSGEFENGFRKSRSLSPEIQLRKSYKNTALNLKAKFVFEF